MESFWLGVPPPAKAWHPVAALVGNELSDHGFSIAQGYAVSWAGGTRDLVAERTYPELRPWFYDIRNDTDAALRFLPTEV